MLKMDCMSIHSMRYRSRYLIEGDEIEINVNFIPESPVIEPIENGFSIPVKLSMFRGLQPLRRMVPLIVQDPMATLWKCTTVLIHL